MPQGGYCQRCFSPCANDHVLSLKASIRNMGQAHAGRYEIEKRFDGQKILFIDVGETRNLAQSQFDLYTWVIFRIAH